MLKIKNKSLGVIFKMCLLSANQTLRDGAIMVEPAYLSSLVTCLFSRAASLEGELGLHVSHSSCI